MKNFINISEKQILDRIAQADAELESVPKTATAAAAGNPRRVLAEGDSWFQYVIGRDIVDWLERMGHTMKHVAYPGATVNQMVFGEGQSLFGSGEPSQLALTIDAMRKFKPEIFLFSGGGNDFVGDTFELFLNHKNSGLPPLNSAVADAFFASIEYAYQFLIKTINVVASEDLNGPIPIVLHGYAHAYPDGSSARFLFKKFGPWMGPSFEERGFELDNDAHLAERRAVVIDLIDRFNSMIQHVANQHENVHYLNLRPMLEDHEDWANELHPTRQGFQKVAQAFSELFETL